MDRFKTPCKNPVGAIFCGRGYESTEDEFYFVVSDPRLNRGHYVRAADGDSAVIATVAEIKAVSPSSDLSFVAYEIGARDIPGIDGSGGGYHRVIHLARARVVNKSGRYSDRPVAARLVHLATPQEVLQAMLPDTHEKDWIPQGATVTGFTEDGDEVLVRTVTGAVLHFPGHLVETAPAST